MNAFEFLTVDDRTLLLEQGHRSAAELRSLFARSHFGRLPVTVDVDATGLQLLARCRKT
jgi:hypothetical protein